VGSVREVYNKLEERVLQETSLQDTLFCESGPSSLPIQAHAPHLLPQDPLANNISRKLAKLQTFQLLTTYIEYTIRQL
jgi:hypothetical protein